MLGTDEIQEIVQHIQTELHPRRIVLFGSYAEDKATEQSDVDLLVVADTALPPHKRYAFVRRLLAAFPASFDIVVKTPDEYEQRRTVVNDIVYFADKYGRVLYEA